MATEIEKQFFDTFGISKIYKTTINIGDLDVNLKEIQAPTLKELYEMAKYDFTTPIYFSWFKRSKRWSEDYPQITDRILLELICIEFTENPYKCRGYTSNAEELKEYILNQFIHEFENDFYLDKEDVKQQVQALFEENNNDR